MLVTNVMDRSITLETTRRDRISVEPGESFETDHAILRLQRMRQPGLSVRVQKGEVDQPVRNRPLPVIISGALSRSDGYANALENLWLAMSTDLRFDARLFNVWLREESDLFDATLDALEIDSTEPAPVAFMLAPPRFYHCVPAIKRVGWTMFETADILHWHPDWPDLCSYIDALIVPHEWQVEHFRDQVFDGPIYVVPLLLSPNITFMRREVKDYAFKVGTWGVLTERKGVQETIDAFNLAFPENQYPHCQLSLKTKLGRLGHPSVIDPRDDPRIVVYDDIWTEDKMIRFMYGLDAAIFLSRGEGFGMPAREAIVSGLPTVVHTVTGHAGLDAFTPWCVQPDRVESSHMGGDWPVANIQQAADHLLAIFSNRRNALVHAAHGAEVLSKVLSPEVIVNELHDLYWRVWNADN